VSLVASFFRQKSVDLYITTSAIEATGRLALAFKSSFLPQPDYDTVLFWVLQAYPFAQVLMKKLKLGPALSQIGSFLASLAVGTDKILQRRWPRRSSASLSVREISVSEIGDDFQALWQEKLNEKPRLFADRSPAALRWHFEIPGDRGSVRALCCYKNRELVGYAIVRNDTNPENGLRSSMIADMVARQDDSEVVRALWVAAYDHAKHVGSHILEVLGFPPNIRSVCSRWNPYLRKYPACPFLYKAADPALHQTLSEEMAWYASPFDGDMTLIRPSYSSPALPATAGMRIQDNGNGVISDVPGRARTEVI
jgi:hypothetical protein